ncbi:MAG: peptidase M48 [Zetaproteobacteria bacterium]|nr:MAG: peptidase M48 [Zetaproteobacteria bacterium]
MIAIRTYQHQKWRNIVHSIVLLVAMMMLFFGLGRFLFGPTGSVFMLLAGTLMLLFAPQASMWMTLRMFRARRLSPWDAPDLHAMIETLATRGGLEHVPEIYWVPSAVPNAFAMSGGGRTLVAVSDGLLRLLNGRELAGVLAHEISHIRHGDLFVMSMADMLSRMTALMSDVGWISLLLFLPVSLLYGIDIPWMFILLLMVAPMLSMLLQLALSRTREFDADLGAVELTNDPIGLAHALLKIEQGMRHWWRWILPGSEGMAPSLLRTHPLTSERVERLRSLVGDARGHPLFDDSPIEMPGHPVQERRRWRGIGFWY